MHVQIISMYIFLFQGTLTRWIYHIYSCAAESAVHINFSDLHFLLFTPYASYLKYVIVSTYWHFYGCEKLRAVFAHALLCIELNRPFWRAYGCNIRLNLFRVK